MLMRTIPSGLSESVISSLAGAAICWKPAFDIAIRPLETTYTDFSSSRLMSEFT